MSELVVPPEAISTETYWDFNGVPLQTYAWNVETWGPEREGVIPLRGENVKIPHTPGALWVPKMPDSRVIPLAMWVIGSNPDGTIRDRDVWESNWRALRRLFWQPRRQFQLTKRWRNDNGELVTATALAQYSGGMQPEATVDLDHAVFTVDLLLADPWFYGPAGAPHHLDLPDTPSIVIPAAGDDVTRRITVDLTGPLDSPTLTNTTREPNVWLRYGASILDSEHVVLDVEAWKATAFTAGGPVKAIGNVSHSGSYPWLEIGPEETTLVLSAQSGTGFADVTVVPVYQ